MKRLLSMCVFVCVGGECVLSIFISKSVWLGGFNQWRCHTTDFFEIFRIYERKRVYFSPYEFFFIISIYTWCMKKKNVLPCAYIYIQGCKCSGRVKSLEICVNEGTPTMIFVLYTINVDCTHTIQKISCNFRKKIQNFAKCKYTRGQIQ